MLGVGTTEMVTDLMLELGTYDFSCWQDALTIEQQVSVELLPSIYCNIRSY